MVAKPDRPYRCWLCGLIAQSAPWCRGYWYLASIPASATSFFIKRRGQGHVPELIQCRLLPLRAQLPWLARYHGCLQSRGQFDLVEKRDPLVKVTSDVLRCCMDPILSALRGNKPPYIGLVPDDLYPHAFPAPSVEILSKRMTLLPAFERLSG